MTNLNLMIALSEQMSSEGITGDPDELQRRYNLALAGQWKLEPIEERSEPMAKRKSQSEAELSQPPDSPTPQPPTPDPQPPTPNPLTIPVDLVDPNPEQPRTDFKPEELQELADNIKANGIIQPITVERSGDRYILHDGERRLRASKLAGLAEIPAYITQPVPAADRRVRAVVANLQRDDLNAIELATSLQEMKDTDNLTDEQIAEKISKNRQWVTNKRSLLRLPDVLRNAIAAGTVDERHGHRFLPLTKIKPHEMDGLHLAPDPNFSPGWGALPTPNALAARIARGGLTSDEVERIVKRIQEAVEQANQRKTEAAARAERQAELKTKIADLPCLNCGKTAFRLGLSDEIICNYCGQEWTTLAAYERHAAAKAEREEQDRVKVAELEASLASVEEWIANPPAEGPAEKVWTIRTHLTSLANLYQGVNQAFLMPGEVISRYDAAKRSLLAQLEQAESLLSTVAGDDPVRAQTNLPVTSDPVPAADLQPAVEPPLAEPPLAEQPMVEQPMVEPPSTQPSNLPTSPTPSRQPPTPKPPPAITLPTKAETQITIRFPPGENGQQTFVALLSKPGQLLPKTYRGPITEVGALIQQAAAEALAQVADKILAETWTQKELGGANGNELADPGLANSEAVDLEPADENSSDDEFEPDDEIEVELEEMES